MAQGDRPVVHRLHAKLLEPLDRTEDVEHGVHRPDLVQMHPLGRHSVHPPLCLPQQAERLRRALPHPIGDRCALDEPQQVTNVTPVWLLRDRELDLLAADAGTMHVPDLHADARESEPARQPFEPRHGKPEGQEAAQRHVAADSRGWIDDGDTHARI